MLGSTEIMVVGGVVVLLFGASAIPKFARSLGKAKKEFKDGMEESTSEENDADDKKAVEKEK
ncbi:twin-arginine translocase TatA/TatE family subunit [Oceanispirochaeta sp.]|jgi:sec-independent protein translocase protein TatA|uniref:twin-arginine translocase TatA/TatE family subunit n=1 Tax=Oceanispirochaeta sp. TaxID=2035350 RepID=UPI0026323293|nr:twin-arginine translocase TatA/TatE family subunit [Oceanispirochaeta sp.]MDA3956792.1 twin-arginine translocase TatA/TatE family subunit [Oceanispirochaeta sp.]